MPEKVTIYHKKDGFAEMWAASADEAIRDHPDEWSRKPWPNQKPNPTEPVAARPWTSSDPADQPGAPGRPQRHDKDSPAYDPRYPPAMVTQGAQNPEREDTGPIPLKEPTAKAAAEAKTKAAEEADKSKASHRR